MLPTISEVLYHGTAEKFQKIDVLKGRNNKDFGKGFYIKIDTEYAKTLNIKYFKTADDDTMVCLNSYWRGFYGEVGSEEAKEKLLSFLEPENLGIQYYVGRQNVADKLILNIQEIKWS